MKIDPNAPAYPFDPEASGTSCRGMTIRAAMATQIMAGMEAVEDGRAWDGKGSVEQWRKTIFAQDARTAVMKADALIAALNAGPDGSGVWG